ncbi:hypothetical protein NZ47_04970 [Anaerovibrio lipolyticus]|uniref:NodB homology domain-containing protein n=1 Tax=Anaerovibrio lipolyticus TaxID=82374 RepID=A0A0B2K0R8_9FIRM|nr:polysaccharide deacetylase family protein [Anaerovibrio lipolyticus]KHM52426.1 hypothetical protein NZ47_04970 [Anaerovibrio lipolyticus]
MGHEELLDFCQRHKRLFCYGAGKYAMTVREFLFEQKIELERFIVSTSREQNNIFMGLPVNGVADVLPVENDVGIIIGVGESKHDEIKDTLHQYGVMDYFAVDKNCFMDIDSHTEYDKQWTDHDKKVCVLLYHRVCDLPLDIWGLAIKPEVFERHIRFYKENYNILRFDEDWSNVQEPSLVITFDDGYADNLHYALPILEKYQVPATIFVSSGNIGTDKEFWWDELERIIFYNEKNEYYFRPNDKIFSLSTYEEKKEACQRVRLFLKKLLPKEREDFLKGMVSELDADRLSRSINRTMNEKELRIMASSPYITIGGHTVTHNMLSAESKEQQEWEIITSKKRIEEIIDNEITVFSYPFGRDDDINEHSFEAVKKAGYKRAATTSVGVAGKGKEPYKIPRNSMPFYQNNRDLKKQLSVIYTLL